ncbi:hypothetical protein [Actinomadura sp. WMMB 499]|uniref:hypothetical protein n=1 Tax=Actinomadura sp. WMMB 499 TaxID=1219491 RepID=UPI001244E860|nr:hypothetical protein [Actinomadura sp. WMMB 499]QFG22484.1 hypothetical protein F7P10_16490 [Actinomadura sp. WMMB 499]
MDEAEPAAHDVAAGACAEGQLGEAGFRVVLRGGRGQAGVGPHGGGGAPEPFGERGMVGVLRVVQADHVGVGGERGEVFGTSLDEEADVVQFGQRLQERFNDLLRFRAVAEDSALVEGRGDNRGAPGVRGEDGEQPFGRLAGKAELFGERPGGRCEGHSAERDERVEARGERVVRHQFGDQVALPGGGGARHHAQGGAQVVLSPPADGRHSREPARAHVERRLVRHAFLPRWESGLSCRPVR